MYPHRHPFQVRMNIRDKSLDSRFLRHDEAVASAKTKFRQERHAA
jgi:hypothetical protein